MQLPKALAPWSALLSLFPKDVAVGVGGMVRKLAMQIKPLRGKALYGSEEPDGLSGLQTKAAYERLLMSEWLLAEAMPDEFDRRAVMGEHLFLQRQTKQSQDAITSMILFDCGPSQLGAPRVVHIALLILMARRAHAADAIFYWGVLHEPNNVNRQVTANTILKLIQSRTCRSSAINSFEKWRQTIDERDAWTDLWVIGSEGGIFSNPLTNVVCIEDDLMPNIRSVSVQIHTQRQMRQTQLILPADSMCTRLLRDPFRVQQVSPVRTPMQFASNTCPLFSSNGRKFVTLLKDGNIVVYPVPNSTRAINGVVGQFSPPSGHAVVAVQVLRRRIISLSTYQGRLYFHRFPGLCEGYSLSLSGIPKINLATVGQLKSLFYSNVSGCPHCALFVDDVGQLVRLNWPNGEIHAAVIACNVISSVMLGAKLWWVKKRNGHEVELLEGVDLSHAACGTTIKLDQELRAEVFINGAPALSSHGPLVSVSTGTSLWKLCSDNLSILLSEYSNTEVLGAFFPPQSFFERNTASKQPMHWPALVFIDNDRQCLTVANQKQQFSFPNEPAKIVRAVLEPNYNQIAALLENNELVIYSLLRQKCVMRLMPEQDYGVV